MRVLVVDTYYAAFLNAFYAQHRDLPLRPYAQQHRVLMEQCFGTADFYSANLSRIGQEAIEVVSNCEQLQRQWAVEHGVKLKESGWNKVRGLVSWAPRTGSIDWFHTVLTAQVKQYSPDVLYIQDMNSLNPGFLREVKQYARLIVGQIACPISPGADFSEYDLILSSLPLLVEGFRRDGLASEYFKLGFEPRVLERLSESKRSGVAFVGSLSPNHAETYWAFAKNRQIGSTRRLGERNRRSTARLAIAHGLPRRGLGTGHVPGATQYMRRGQSPYRYGGFLCQQYAPL